MKVTYPLSLKISVWLLLNLVALAAMGGALYWWQFGRGWQSLTVGAVGERFQAVADNIMSSVHAAPADDRARVLAARATQHGVELYVFQNDGTPLLGGPTALPEAFRDELLRGYQRSGPFFAGKGPGRGPRGEEPPPRRGPPPGSEEFAPKRGPLGNARPAGMGRFVVRTGDPAETWLGIRVPYQREDAPPLASTLVIRAGSIRGIVSLLAIAPWFGVIAGVFVLSVLFWLPLVAGITRSLRRLTRATEAIAEGHFDTRVADRRRDEIGHLGHSVNRMAARLETLVNGQKRFLGDVAHELGSPLGRLQVATEILEERAPAALRANVADVREEVQQMAALVNELLAFTKAGLRPRDAELADVELRPLVDEVLAREGATARVRVEVGDGLGVRADRPLLARALGNLVRNALRYAGEGATITVQARRDDGHTRVAVEDDGPGVPPEALARLGEPFYRPEAARARETGGVGLGLAIVRSGVAACGGEVRFANRTPRGFHAEIRLVSTR